MLKTFSFVLLIFTVALVIFEMGFLAGIRMMANQTPNTDNASLSLMTNEPILSISGEISKIEQDKIYLNTPSQIFAREKGASPAERAVLISEQTEIVKHILKSGEELEAEVEEGLPPQPFNEEKIKMGDLKAGDLISVSAEQDIGYAEEFTALKITISALP